jgi:hypothetical protein
MPQDAACPKCAHSFPVTEARHPFTVACPRCEAELTAEFKKPATAPEAGEPPYDLLVKSGALPGSAAPTPAPKRKKDDDDEDEPKRKGGSALIVLVSGGLGLLFVLGGLSVTGWYLFTQIDFETAANTRANNSSGNKGNQNPGNKGTGPAPKVDPYFDLNPVRPAGLPPIVPPNLAEDVSQIDLGGKAGAVTVGGGGRYIVLHLPDKGQLACFDASSGKVTFQDADRANNVQLAAGASQLVLYSPGANIMRVYALPALQKQFDFPSPVNGLKAIAMGSRTNGPFVGIGTWGDPHLFDLSGLGIKEVMEARKEGLGLHHNHIRALPDGSAFSTFDGFRNNQRTTLLTTEGRQWKSVKDVGEVPFPAPDGNFYGNGVVMNSRGANQGFGGVGAGSGTWFVPASSGTGHFLKVATGTLGAGAKAKKTIGVTIHSNRNSDAPLAGTTPLNGLPEFDNLLDRSGNFPAVAYDQHLFLIPEAKLLVTLVSTKDKLVLRKI